MSESIREVDPNDLRLPPSRASGADPWKLHQQIGQFGIAKDGMPPIFVYEDPEGVLEISDGVTRGYPDSKAGTWRNGPGRRDRALPPQSDQFSVREGSIVNAIETRAKLFAALEALTEVVPEMRGGQLMAAVGELCVDLHGRGLWDADDAELLEAVWQFRRGFEAATAPQRRTEAESVAAANRPRE